MRYSVRQRGKFHITSKPTPLMEHLVQIVSAPALLRDPLMESGTSIVACCTQERQFIGIEREAHYFAIAQERLVEVGKGKAICRFVDPRWHE